MGSPTLSPLLFGAVLLSACVAGDATPVAELETRAEATDYVETSRYADVMAFSEAVAAADPRIHLTTMGYSMEGRPIPLLVVGDVADPSWETVRTSGKLRIYAQGSIHAGEVPGKEALQMLLREIALGRYDSWLESAVLLIAPMYNVDGSERVSLTNRRRQNGPVGGMGQRPNAQGLDLNRDHMKLDSPEARSLVGMMNDYDPHLSLDLHTTNGTRHAYHLTYAEPLNPATAPEIQRILRDELLPEVTRTIKEKHGWDYYFYGGAYGGTPRGGGGVGFAPRGREAGWYTFDSRPRFNTNYIGLRNRLAILSEAYAYATFEDRVLATYRFVEEIVTWAAERADEIVELTETLDETGVVGEELAVRAEFQGSEEPVDILMGDVRPIRHPYTGQTMFDRLDVSTPTPMRTFTTFAPAETSTVPEAYLVPADLEVVVDRLRAHGIHFNPLGGEFDFDVGATQVFRIDSTTVSPRPFQGHNERTLFGSWESNEAWETQSIEETGAQWLFVEVGRPLGRLAFYLLEPRSDDGLVNWGLMDEALEGADRYPILRIPARD